MTITPADSLTLAALLAGFAFGIALMVWGLLDHGPDEGDWGGPDDDPEPEPLPGPSGRELVGAGR